MRKTVRHLHFLLWEMAQVEYCISFELKLVIICPRQCYSRSKLKLNMVNALL